MSCLFCSAKLSKLIGLKEKHPSLSPYNWNAHLFALQRRKCIVFVHKETFYSFVVFDILKKDLLRLQKLFVNHFVHQLRSDNILSDDLLSDGTLPPVLQNLLPVALSTTDGDKSAIGFMNDCIARLTWERSGRSPTIDEAKHYVAQYYNDVPILSRGGVSPVRLMAEKLEFGRKNEHG